MRSHCFSSRTLPPRFDVLALTKSICSVHAHTIRRGRFKQVNIQMAKQKGVLK